MSAVRLMGEAWRSVLELLSPEWELDGIVEVVDNVLGWLVDERPVYLSLSSSLSALLLSYVAVAAAGRVCRVLWSERLVDAMVNHQQPMARCNVYAAVLVLLSCIAAECTRQGACAGCADRPSGPSAVTADGGRDGWQRSDASSGLVSAMLPVGSLTFFYTTARTPLVPYYPTSSHNLSSETTICG